MVSEIALVWSTPVWIRIRCSVYTMTDSYDLESPMILWYELDLILCVGGGGRGLCCSLNLSLV